MKSTYTAKSGAFKNNGPKEYKHPQDRSISNWRLQNKCCLNIVVCPLVALLYEKKSSYILIDSTGLYIDVQLEFCDSLRHASLLVFAVTS